VRCILRTFLPLCKKPACLRQVCGAVWHTKSPSVTAASDDILRGVCCVSFCIFHLHNLLLSFNTQHFITVNTEATCFGCTRQPSSVQPSSVQPSSTFTILQCEDHTVCMCIAIRSPYSVHVHSYTFSIQCACA
jgi:hypothetical protein